MHGTTIAFLIHSKHSPVEFTDKALLNKTPTKKLVWQKTISTNVKRIAPQHDSLAICMSFSQYLRPENQETTSKYIASASHKSKTEYAHIADNRNKPCNNKYKQHPAPNVKPHSSNEVARGTDSM